MSQEEASAELELLTKEFGKDDEPAVQLLAPTLLEFYHDKARIAPRLRYWYVTRHLIDHLRKTKCKDAVDTMEGDNRYHLRERILSLENMRNDANTEIEKLERQARAGRVPKSGQMITLAPRQAVCGERDPNADRYRGSPTSRSYSPK